MSLAPPPLTADVRRRAGVVLLPFARFSSQGTPGGVAPG